MTNFAIKVDNLSKRYRIGTMDEKHDTLGGFIQSVILSPFRNYKKIKSLSTFNNNEDENIIWAIEKITFEIQHGTLLGIIGKNGAGKSTLLKILSRITAPSSGSAKINGRIASLLEVGTGFHPDLSGRENIFLNGTLLGMKKNEIMKNFNNIVDFSGVGKFIDTPIKRYSSGMRVRLAFSVAAYLEAEILLIDEVLAVGDIEFQNKCISKMEDISKQGRTILFVSHNMGAIQSICDTGLLLSNGRLDMHSDINSVLNKYVSNVDTNILEKDLNEVENRTGGKIIRIQSIKIIDTKSGNKIQNALSGQNVTIEIYFKNLSAEIIEKVNFAISFYNASMNFMFACSGRPINKLFNASPGENCVKCEIKKLPINSGRIYIGLHCDSKDQTLDNIKEAGYIDIEKGDYYGTGILPAPKKQGLLIDYNFNK